MAPQLAFGNDKKHAALFYKLLKIKRMEKELPEGWEWKELEKVADILDNLRVPINSDERSKRQGDIPYYGATGQVGWIDDYIFDEELILIGEDGAPFFDSKKDIAYQVNGKSWVNNHAHVLRGKEGVLLNKILLHFLNIFDFHGFVDGTTRLKLTQGSLRKIPIKLPPLPEQHRIVAKLDAVLAKVDSARGHLERVPGILQRFRQSVIDHNFSGEIVRLGDVLDEIKYGTSKKCTEEVHGTPVLRIPNIGNGIVDQSDLKYAEFDKTEYEKLKLEEGDVLIIRSNGSVSLVGKAAIAGKSEVGFLYAGYLMRLRADKKRLLPEYLNLALSSYNLRFQIEQTAKSTSGVNNINSKEIQDLQIPLPPLAEQQAIVRRVQSLFAVADRLEARYEALKEKVEGLPQALLAKAFRGELVGREA